MPLIVATLAIGLVIPGRLRSKRARNPLRNRARCQMDSGFGSASRPGMTEERMPNATYAHSDAARQSGSPHERSDMRD